LTQQKLDERLADELKNAVDDAFEEQLAALEDLVEHPSHTYASDDVEAAAQVLDALSADVGLRVEKHDAGDERFADHRVYSSPAAGDSATLALVGHIDTVFPRSSGFLKYRREDDVARGPGVLDMKSGLTTILFGLRAVRDVLGDRYDDFPVRFVCVTDEEVGSPTSRHLYEKIADRMSHALVFEKGRDEDRIITCRKGGGTFRVGVEGTAAHAGNHHDKGVNAIHALSLVIPKIEAMTDYASGTTVNVGLIEGGTAKNTVPQHASCTIDARFITAEDAAAFEERLQTLVNEPLDDERLKDVHFTVTGTITRPPMEATEENKALCERYGAYATAVGLGNGEAPRQGGFSDSNLLAAQGIPTIDGLGPFGHGAHSHDEWCSLPSLRRRTEALAMFLAEELARHSD
jgi:glutamate carboxypeptidase